MARRITHSPASALRSSHARLNESILVNRLVKYLLSVYRSHVEVNACDEGRLGPT